MMLVYVVSVPPCSTTATVRGEYKDSLKFLYLGQPAEWVCVFKM